MNVCITDRGGPKQHPEAWKGQVACAAAGASAELNDTQKLVARNSPDERTSLRPSGRPDASSSPLLDYHPARGGLCSLMFVRLRAINQNSPDKQLVEGWLWSSVGAECLSVAVGCSNLVICSCACLCLCESRLNTRPQCDRRRRRRRHEFRIDQIAATIIGRTSSANNSQRLTRRSELPRERRKNKINNNNNKWLSPHAATEARKSR